LNGDEVAGVDDVLLAARPLRPAQLRYQRVLRRGDPGRLAKPFEPLPPLKPLLVVRVVA